MTIWFGRLGALSALPDPLRGMTVPAARAGTEAATIGGGRVVSFAPGSGRRRFQMGWNHLDPDHLTIFEEYFAGLRGPGPFVLLDPARRNHLTANQAGATSASNDATGFTVDASEAVTSNPDAFLRGPRSARWTLPATVTSGVFELAPPAGLVGVPAPSGQPWTFSGSVSLAGLVSSVSVTPALSWRRVDGSEVSATLGTPVAAVPGSWTAYSVSAAPPAGAAAVRAQLRVATGALSTSLGGVDVVDLTTAPPSPPRLLGPVAGGPSRPVVSGGWRPPTSAVAFVARAPHATSDLLVDQLQLDMFNGVRAWVAGTGVPQVSMVDLSPVYDQFYPYASIAATFVEVG